MLSKKKGPPHKPREGVPNSCANDCEARPPHRVCRVNEPLYSRDIVDGSALVGRIEVSPDGLTLGFRVLDVHGVVSEVLVGVACTSREEAAEVGKRFEKTVIAFTQRIIDLGVMRQAGGRER